MTDLTQPPTRSTITGALAAAACVACCALPFLVAVGVLTGAGAALAQNLLLASAILLLTAAAGMWWLHRRAATRRASRVVSVSPAALSASAGVVAVSLPGTAGRPSACGDENCAC